MFRFYQAAFLVVLVAGCGSQTGNIGVDQFIEPGITGHSREVMRKILSMVPENQRQNVIYFDSDGTIYTNRPRLLQGLVTLSRDSSGHWVDAQGQRFDPPIPDDAGPNSGVSLSSVQPPACPYKGSGFYRSVYTTTGFTSISANISTFPGGTASTLDGAMQTGDTATVYLGGSSGQSNFDAGVFYETIPGRIASPQYRWSYFINPGGGKPYLYVPPSTSSKNQLWLDTSPSYMQFQVIQNGYLQFYVEQIPDPTAYSRNSSPYNNISFIFTGAGWTTDGKNQLLKRATSIAQNGGEKPNSGSAFSATWYGVTLIGPGKNVDWTFPDNRPETSKPCNYDSGKVAVTQSSVPVQYCDFIGVCKTVNEPGEKVTIKTPKK